MVKMAASIKILFISLTTLLLETTSLSKAANILVIIPFPMRSHDIIYKPLLAELANRGHFITEVTQFPSKYVPKKNYRQIAVETRHTRLFDIIDFHQMRKETALWNIGWTELFTYWDLTYEVLDDIYQNEEIVKIVKSKTETFDLIICEGFFGFESLFAFGQHFNAPSIAVSSLGSTTYMNQHIGNPILSASYPNFLLPYDDKMTLVQRFHNSLLNFYIIVATKVYHIPKQETLIAKYFTGFSTHTAVTETPSLTEMLKEVSLVFINRNPILGFPRPYVPNVIDIAGLHLQPNCQNSSNIDTELQTRMDSALFGVIYFSFGSNVNVAKMSKEHRAAFMNSFSRIPQLILWKWDDSVFPDQPKNVIIRKWFPQQEILAHKKCRLFITHGGMLSLEEAVYNAVPVIGVPFFGDQPMNMLRAQENGFALMLDYRNITEESVYWAVHEILHNAGYRRKAQMFSSIFRDNPQTPLEKAVYWVEYVLRHNGAPHLRSSARNLNWIQYLLLDVTLLALILILALLFSIKVVIRQIRHLLFSKPKSNVTKSKND